MFYSINRPNFFVWLPLLLEILDNICIGITCLLVCDALNFEIDLNFFYQTVFPQTKKVGKKLLRFRERKELNMK